MIGTWKGHRFSQAPQFRHAPGARHDAGYGGTGERIVQALRHSERFSRRGQFLTEEIPAAEGFHYCHPRAQPLKCLVEMLPGRVHVGQTAGVAVVQLPWSAPQIKGNREKRLINTAVLWDTVCRKGNWRVTWRRNTCLRRF